MKKTILSGIQPTGRLTLGNYIGAIKSWLDLQDKNDNELILFIANLHALTTAKHDPQLAEKTKDLIMTLAACGLDLKKCSLFIQSDIPAHSELAYIITCESYLGELSRMHQYKEKKGDGSVPTGILVYPTLMAADILLYQPDIIPVGEDQVQHVELTRDIATRINNKFHNPLFKLPSSFLPNVGARIYSLSNPTKKMSKSDPAGDKSIIYLDDSDEAIRKKIAGAVTDLDNQVKFDPVNKPGISNLLTIYCALKNIDISAGEKLFNQSSYRDFKLAVADTLVNLIAPIRNRRAALSWMEIVQQLHENSVNMNKIAQENLNKIKYAYGLSIDRTQ